MARPEMTKSWKKGPFVEIPWREPSNRLVKYKYTLLVASLIDERPYSRMFLPGITSDFCFGDY